MVTEAAASGEKTITKYEKEQVHEANKTGKPSVVFVHGLWLMPNGWDRWVTVFEDAGYVGLTPGWPDDPDTVEAADRALAFVRQFVHSRGRARNVRRGER